MTSKILGSNDAPAIYGLKFQSRCITSVLGDSEHHKFLVGTLSLNAENEIHLLEFSEEEKKVWSDAIFAHPAEVWSISTCPSKKDLFFTTYNTGEEYCASLWKMENSKEGDGLGIKEMLKLPSHKGPIHKVLWDPSGITDRVISIDDTNISEYRVNHSFSEAKEGMQIKVSASRRMLTGCWDPHHHEQVAVGAETSISLWDLRAKKATKNIDQAHGQGVRDIEFNPNKPYVLASAGDDGRIKFWDMREATKPLRVLCGHSHWASCVRFNPFHDRLILSSGTDGLVNLWNVTSVSSAPVGSHHLDAAAIGAGAGAGAGAPSSSSSSPSTTMTAATSPSSGAGAGAAGSDKADDDRLLKTLNEHEDSVYSVAWSSCEAWIFASVSYDGRVLVHHVPQEEKYKILDL